MHPSAVEPKPGCIDTITYPVALARPGEMGRKLDLSGLTDDEAEHVLKVVQRDMKLRKKEEDRLRVHFFDTMTEANASQEVDHMRSQSHGLGQAALLDCHYNVCKTCWQLQQAGKESLALLHHLPEDRSLLMSLPPDMIAIGCSIFRTQSLEWYYNNVKSRFKRFGSAKVLKTLYRNHISGSGRRGGEREGEGRRGEERRGEERRGEEILEGQLERQIRTGGPFGLYGDTQTVELIGPIASQQSPGTNHSEDKVARATEGITSQQHQQRVHHHHPTRPEQHGHSPLSPIRLAEQQP
ncbi:unnamed protein product [Coregonus sp. 'balchen']|nr:unnamed protein product [Coregonus sp. 'balchen']